METRLKHLGFDPNISVEELIHELPEKVHSDRGDAFLEITSNHVFYCTRHDNKGRLDCVFVAIGMGLRKNLISALEWIKEGHVTII